MKESLGTSPGALPSGGLVFQLVRRFHRYCEYSSKSTVRPKMESCFQDDACSVCFLLHTFTRRFIRPHSHSFILLSLRQELPCRLDAASRAPCRRWTPALGHGRRRGVHCLSVENGGALTVSLACSKVGGTSGSLGTPRFTASVVATCSGKQTHSEGQCRQWSAVYYAGAPRAESPLSQGPRPAFAKTFYTPCARA